MNPVNARLPGVANLFSHRLIRRQHEFLDELVALVVFAPLRSHGIAIVIHDHFYFRKIEIECALIESTPA